VRQTTRGAGLAVVLAVALAVAATVAIWGAVRALARLAQ